MSKFGRWIYYDGKLLTPAQFHKAKYGGARVTGPHIINDNLDDVMNHADGKRYSSKRAFEKAVRAAGCEIVGNDPSFKRPKAQEYDGRDIKSDIKRAMDEVSSR